VRERDLPAVMDPRRLAAIRIIEDKWLNGTDLRYYFFPLAQGDGTQADIAEVKAGFAEWKAQEMGLTFKEVSQPSEAEIRISFDHRDGSWSYVGRQVLNINASMATMNFGWPLTQSQHGRDTARHEIGHTLGLPHEHQNPHAGIVWNEEAVYNYFKGPPNFWDRATVEWNILRKISPSEVEGSDWDRNSIMHYRIDRGLILEPAEFRTTALVPAGGLSAQDKLWIRKFYPPMAPEPQIPLLEPFRSVRLDITAGQQADFRVTPQETRWYTFQTFGSADTVMALFERVSAGGDAEGLRLREGDDDSGTDRNARFGVRLFVGREYVLRVRLFWAWASGKTAVMMW
jgi:hypothetical protein